MRLEEAKNQPCIICNPTSNQNIQYIFLGFVKISFKINFLHTFRKKKKKDVPSKNLTHNSH